MTIQPSSDSPVEQIEKRKNINVVEEFERIPKASRWEGVDRIIEILKLLAPAIAISLIVSVVIFVQQPSLVGEQITSSTPVPTTVPTKIQDNTLIGNIEISYGYNSMAGGGNSGRGNPVGSVSYCGQMSRPIIMESLAPGIYEVTIVSGRQSGNPGCGEHRSDNGFAGGITGTDSTQCKDSICPLNYYGIVWIGESVTKGQFINVASLYNSRRFKVSSGEKLWFYWHDWWAEDNYGGVTIELRRISLS